MDEKLLKIAQTSARAGLEKFRDGITANTARGINSSLVDRQIRLVNATITALDDATLSIDMVACVAVSTHIIELNGTPKELFRWPQPLRERRFSNAAISAFCATNPEFVDTL
jgi:hypothetical protein